MAPLRANDFNLNYQNTFGNSQIQQFEVYTHQHERVGNVVDALVNEAGQFQQLIVNLDPSIAAKQVLLPLNETHIDQRSRRIYLDRLSKAQVVNLPTYHSANVHSTTVSEHGLRRDTKHSTVSEVAKVAMPVEVSVPLEASAPLEGWTIANTTESTVTSEQAATRYDQPPTVVQSHTVDQRNLQTPPNAIDFVQAVPKATPEVREQETIRLLEERLVVNRGQRRKVGEVVARKEIETRMVEIPVRREKLIIEQVSPEYKQLAVVTLRQTDRTGAEITEDTHFSDQSDRSIVSGDFTSAEAASRFLDAVAHHPDARYQKVRINITVDDPQLQGLYQQWLEQYRK